MTKHIANALGSTGVGMIAYARIPNSTAPDTTGTLVAVSDTFDAYSSGGASPANLRGNYIAFKRVAATGIVTSAADLTSIRIESDYSGQVLALKRATNLTDGEVGVAITYPTGNDITAQFLCFARANDDAINHQRPDACGPFVRAATDLTSMIVAYLKGTGQPNVVQLVIDKLTTSGVTRIGTSRKLFSLKGGGNRVVDLQIRLQATTTTLTATLTWPSGAPGGLSDTLQVTNSDLSTQNRGGVLYRATGEGSGSLSEREIVRLSYTRKETYDWPVIDTALAANIETINGSTYVQPANKLASYGAFAGAPTTNTTAGTDTGFGAVQNWPTVKTDSDYYESVGVSSDDRTLEQNAISSELTTSSSAIYAVDLAFLAIDTGGDEQTPIFLASSDGKKMLRVEMTRQIDATSKASGQSWIKTIKVVAIHATATAARTRKEIIFNDYTGGVTKPIIFPTSQFLRVRVTNAGTANATVEVWCQNVLLLSMQYGNDVDWTTITSGREPNGTRCGVDITGYGAALQTAGFRIVDTAAPAFSAITSGVDIIALTTSAASIGSSGGSSWTTITGTSTTGSTPQLAKLDSKIYVVDGGTSAIIDITNNANTIGTWANVSNTALDGCSLACIYRRRVVIARQRTAPSIWYMSRFGDGTDFDFGATDASAKAYAGTSPDLGLPGDEITALIPAWDDILYFGCRGSIWALIGDPGKGGSMQNVTHKLGVLSARSWCFGDQNDLYILTPSGLFRIDRVTEGPSKPIALLPGRLTSILEGINTSTTRVTMGFDAPTRLIHIFLTPSDGSTVGTHVVYDVYAESEFGSGGLWLDSYPLAMQPWSCAEVISDTTSDKRLIFMGTDGYLRRFDDSTNTDDGTTIDSYVRFAPFGEAEGKVDTMLSELEIVLASGSGSATWSIFDGSSPTEINAITYTTTPTSTGTVTAGATTPVGLRQTAKWHQLMIRQNASATPFALERALVDSEVVGRGRLSS